MRKFFVSLIVLIVAGGVAFYFGWVQMQLPADSYGVIFTKTGGFERQVMKPGNFVWQWQRLLPTNLTLFVFHLSPETAQITSEGGLPSGALYSQFLDGKPTFAYKISVDVTYVLNPDYLPRLMMHDHVTPKTLGAWYSSLSRRLSTAIDGYIASQAASGQPTALGLAALEPGMKKDLEERFPEVRFTSVAPRTVEMPDLTLYEKAREQYLAIMSAEESARVNAGVARTNLNALAAQKIELLRKYGELFNQYPVLLKYLDLAPAKRQNVIPGF